MRMSLQQLGAHVTSTSLRTQTYAPHPNAHREILTPSFYPRAGSCGVFVLLALLVLPAARGDDYTPISHPIDTRNEQLNCKLQLAAPTAPRWTPVPDAYRPHDGRSEEGDLFMRTATGNTYFSGPADIGLTSKSAPWTEATHFTLIRLQFTTPKSFREIGTNSIQLFGFFGGFRWRESGFGSCARIVPDEAGGDLYKGQLQLFNCGGYSSEDSFNISKKLDNNTNYLLEVKMSPKLEEIEVYLSQDDQVNESECIKKDEYFQFREQPLWEDPVAAYPVTFGHNSPVLPSVNVAPDAPHSRFFPRTDDWGFSWGEWSIGEMFLCLEPDITPITPTPNIRSSWFPELKKYTFTHSNAYPGDAESDRVLIAPFLAFHETESIGTWKDANSQLFKLVSVTLGGADKPKAGATFFERDSNVTGITEQQNYTIWACEPEIETFIMISMKIVEVNGSILAAVSGPRRGDNVSECPSSGEAARNLTANETLIAQHEAADGIGVSAIEVDVYMPYDIHSWSANDGHIPTSPPGVSLPNVSQAMVFLGNIAREDNRSKPSEVSVLHNVLATEFNSSRCGLDMNTVASMNATFKDLPVVNLPVFTPGDPQTENFTAFGLVATCEYSNKSKVSFEDEAAMIIFKLQIDYTHSDTHVHQVETRIKWIEGCHYKTHLAPEVQHAWNCAEYATTDVCALGFCLEGITFLQIGSLPPSPPASPPPPLLDFMPSIDGECACVSCYTQHGFKDLDSVEALGKQQSGC